MSDRTCGCGIDAACGCDWRWGAAKLGSFVLLSNDNFAARGAAACVRACVRACCLPAVVACLAFRRPSRRAFANGHRLSLSAFLLAAPPSPLGPRPGPGLVASTLLA